MAADWDYEIPHKCQYEVAGNPYPGGCGEPAAYYVYYDGGAALWVCKEHLDFMLECEKKYASSGGGGGLINGSQQRRSKMTKEELTDIKERAETAGHMGSIAWESSAGVQLVLTVFKEDIPKLLAEVERLQNKT